MKTHEAGLNETDTALILLDAAGTVLNASTRGHALLAAYHPVRTTDKSLIRIATDVGYASQYSFTTAFRRHHGAPPGTWRQQRVSAPLTRRRHHVLRLPGRCDDGPVQQDFERVGDRSLVCDAVSRHRRCQTPRKLPADRGSPSSAQSCVPLPQ
jgi:AraC-like DNA-binding protein